MLVIQKQCVHALSHLFSMVKYLTLEASKTYYLNSLGLMEVFERPYINLNTSKHDDYSLVRYWGLRRIYKFKVKKVYFLKLHSQFFHGVINEAFFYYIQDLLNVVRRTWCLGFH